MGSGISLRRSPRIDDDDDDFLERNRILKIILECKLQNVVGLVNF